MRSSAVYIVSLIAAVAAVLAVTTAFHNGRVAWTLCGVLLLVLAITIPMYFVKGRTRRTAPEAEIRAFPSAPIIGPVIAAYDQALALGNEANVTINYNSPPAHETSEGESADE